MEEITKWLNEIIGVDSATYISLFLALIGIFFIAKKIYKTVKQSQSITNGIGIQAGRDVKIKKK
jgi:hypothetical protein